MNEKKKKEKRKREKREKEVISKNSSFQTGFDYE